MNTLECFHALLEQSRTLSILPRGPIWEEEEEEEEKWVNCEVKHCYANM